MRRRWYNESLFDAGLLRWGGVRHAKPLGDQDQEIPMSSVKEAMIDIIGRQPEDSSYDEILRELAFARMVQRGLDDSDAGRTVSDDAIKRRMDS